MEVVAPLLRLCLQTLHSKRGYASVEEDRQRIFQFIRDRMGSLATMDVQIRKQMSRILQQLGTSEVLLHRGQVCRRRLMPVGHAPSSSKAECAESGKRHGGLASGDGLKKAVENVPSTPCLA